MVSMKNSKLNIYGQTIHPGETVSLALPLPELFSCAPLYLPFKVIHGKQQGPCLLVIAAMHGDQINGTEIVNRLITLKNIMRIHGTLIAVPIMNVYGLVNRTPHLPGGSLLDNSFPGSKTGNYASRMAHTFMQNIFNHADVCIELQTGDLNHINLPQIYVNLNCQQSKVIAEKFNPAVISDFKGERGQLCTVASKMKKPYIIYEAGEAMRYDQYAIRNGLKGILNVMRHLNMLHDSQQKREIHNTSIYAENNIWVRSPTSGISKTKLKLGQHIKKNDALCTIHDPFGVSDTVNIKSPHDGVIVGINNLPLVHEGDSLFQIAIFNKPKQVATKIQSWQDQNIESDPHKS